MSFLNTLYNDFKSHIDDLGDYMGTSDFVHEKRIWDSETNYELTRKVYNANKESLIFRKDLNWYVFMKNMAGPQNQKEVLATETIRERISEMKILGNHLAMKPAYAI